MRNGAGAKYSPIPQTGRQADQIDAALALEPAGFSAFQLQTPQAAWPWRGR